MTDRFIDKKLYFKALEKIREQKIVIDTLVKSGKNVPKTVKKWQKSKSR